MSCSSFKDLCLWRQHGDVHHKEEAVHNFGLLVCFVETGAPSCVPASMLLASTVMPSKSPSDEYVEVMPAVSFRFLSEFLKCIPFV